MMMKITWADVLTLSGLLLGVWSLVMVFEKQWVWSFYLLCGAAFFDVMDGAVARALGVDTAHGKFLDALADMVSFGVLPTIWVYTFVQQTPEIGWIAYSVLLLTPVVALRLVLFILKGSSDHFSGLPSPAGALFLMSMCLLPQWIAEAVTHTWMVYITIGVMFLMLCPLPILSIKFTDYKWNGNQVRYIFLALAMILCLWLQERVFLVLIPIYVLYSILVHLLKQSRIHTERSA